METPLDQIRWFHSLDLGDLGVTQGIKSLSVLTEELERLRLPEVLHGKRALDIGAWDGFFSFAMESRGAAVVALDYYTWSIDLEAMTHYYNEMGARGQAPLPPHEHPDLWKPEELPGMSGFRTAQAAKASRVRPVVGDFMTMQLEDLGEPFDLILFSGVLYHLEDPMRALRRLVSVCQGTTVIETAVVQVPGHEDAALWQFFEGNELDGDPSNWWAPNMAGLVAACRAAGFSSVEVVAAPADDSAPAPQYRYHYGRAIVHAHV